MKPALGTLLIDIKNCVGDMNAIGRDAILISEWDTKKKKLIVLVVDILQVWIKKEGDIFVEEDELLNLVPDFYIEDEVKNLINGK